MWPWFAGDVIHSPLYLWQELCLEDAPGLQRLGDLSPEEEAPLGQINQNLPDDLAEVHAAAHLLISAVFKSETKLKIALYVCVMSVLRVAFWLLAFWPLFAFVERVLVHRLVVLCPDVIQTAVVSKRPPLHIDTHAALVPVHYLDVPHLLHVTGVTSCPWEDTSPHPVSPQKTLNAASFSSPKWNISIFDKNVFITGPSQKRVKIS